MSSLPDLNYTFPGVSDAPALQLEVAGLRGQLQGVTDQLGLERQLAKSIHTARSAAILASPALKLVFNIDDSDTAVPATSPKVMASDMLSSAFLQPVSTSQLPDGFAQTVSRDLRLTSHPDAGGDTAVAQQIDYSLANTSTDPGFSMASALLVAPPLKSDNQQALRTERYKMYVALAGAQPQFETPEAALEQATPEIEGAAWRVRTIAAFKSVELITGGNESWTGFLQSIVDTRHRSLIDMVNRVQPALLTVQEHLTKGDPIPTANLDISAVDPVLHRVWSTLSPKERIIPYAPPYQSWLETLLPAMEALDPGEKPGVSYTQFEPPIRLVQAPPRYDTYSDYDKGHGGYDKIPNNYISKKYQPPKTNIYNRPSDFYNEKY